MGVRKREIGWITIGGFDVRSVDQSSCKGVVWEIQKLWIGSVSVFLDKRAFRPASLALSRSIIQGTHTEGV